MNIAFLASIAFTISSQSFAQETPPQPYIDELKATLPEGSSDSEGSYTDKIKEKLRSQDQNNPQVSDQDSYTETLKSGLPASPPPSTGYTDQEKERLGPPNEGSAIADFKAGKKLEAKKLGKVNGAGGFKLGASQSRNITNPSNPSATPYRTVYGDGWTPDLNFFYEYRLLDHAWVGSLGLIGNIGLTYNSGQGQFRYQLFRPNGTPFGSESQIKLRFITAPIAVGGIYRLNLSNYVRPYVQAGPAAVLYVENRSDDRSGHKGYSRAIMMSGGVNILLDFIDKEAGWSLYTVSGIKHYYLTLDYTRLTTISGDVDFSVSGLTAGLTFEF